MGSLGAAWHALGAASETPRGNFGGKVDPKLYDLAAIVFEAWFLMFFGLVFMFAWSPQPEGYIAIYTGFCMFSVFNPFRKACAICITQAWKLLSKITENLNFSMLSAELWPEIASRSRGKRARERRGEQRNAKRVSIVCFLNTRWLITGGGRNLTWKVLLEPGPPGRGKGRGDLSRI